MDIIGIRMLKLLVGYPNFCVWQQWWRAGGDVRVVIEQQGQ